MASKRISRSAINWAAFAERVPEEQKPQFQAFKVKSDGYLRRVLSLPENPPPIDFALYRSRITIPSLVDNFEKSYKSFVVPYPKEHVSSLIEQEEREAKRETEAFVSESLERIEEYKKQLAYMETIIPAEHMTMEDYATYYPDDAINIDKPTYWPHDGSIEQAEAEALAEEEQRH